jgi:hypothetical protein
MLLLLLLLLLLQLRQGAWQSSSRQSRERTD